MHLEFDYRVNIVKAKHSIGGRTGTRDVASTDPASQILSLCVLSLLMGILIIWLSGSQEVRVSVSSLMVDGMLFRIYLQAWAYAIRDVTQACRAGACGLYVKMIFSSFIFFVRTDTTRPVKLEEVRAFVFSETWIWALLNIFSYKLELLSRWIDNKCPIWNEEVALEPSK